MTSGSRSEAFTNGRKIEVDPAQGELFEMSRQNEGYISSTAGDRQTASFSADCTEDIPSVGAEPGWRALQAAVEKDPCPAADYLISQTLDQSPDFTAIANLQFGVSLLNPAGRKLLGWENSRTLSGATIFDFFDPKDHAFVRDRIVFSLINDGRWSGETHLRNAGTGEAIPVFFGAYSLRNPAGQTVAFAMTARDLHDVSAVVSARRIGDEGLAFALAAAGGVGTWDWDLKTDLIYANAGLSRLLRVDPLRAAQQGIPPNDYIDAIHPDDRGKVRDRIQQAVSSGGAYTVEYRIPQEDGSDFWCQSVGRAYLDANGVPSRLPGVVLDITERKRTEAALNKALAKAQNILESITDGFFALDKDWCFTYINPAGEQLMRASAQELLGTNHWERFPSVLGTLTEREYRRAFLEKVVVDFEYLHEPAQRWIGIKASPIQEGGLSVYFRDITQQKTAQEGLKRQWRTLDAVLSHIPDHTYILDREGCFLYGNPAVLTFWQTTLENLVGKRLEDLELPAEVLARLRQHVEEVVTTGRAFQDETTLVDHQGDTRHFEYIFSPIYASDGTVEAIAGSSRDIASRKQAEEQERERQVQLLESARLESLGVMAGGIAHDFNNLLVGILGNATLLADEVSCKDNSTVGQILLAAERAAELTNQMLAYSGKGGFVIDIVDVNTLVKENLTLLRASLSRSITVDQDLCCDPLCIQADRSQIQQVIMNLLINASDAVGANAGNVNIRTRLVERKVPMYSDRLRATVPSGSYVLLEVSDNGIGMNGETLKRIFDPFFTTKFTGRGLGLAAVLGIVKGHKGDIEVESKPGVGTTFHVLLPASRDAVPSAGVTTRAVSSRAPGLNVLIVDDEEIVRQMASAALKTGGFQVSTAGNGSEAMEILRTDSSISLVLLDLTMPVMTGEQALPLIRAMRPGLPVILSSGFSHAEISSRFDLSGLAGFLHKPYSAQAIISAATRALQAVS